MKYWRVWLCMPSVLWFTYVLVLLWKEQSKDKAVSFLFSFQGGSTKMNVYIVFKPHVMDGYILALYMFGSCGVWLFVLSEWITGLRRTTQPVSSHRANAFLLKSGIIVIHAGKGSLLFPYGRKINWFFSRVKSPLDHSFQRINFDNKLAHPPSTLCFLSGWL